jgi:hypothetical protein
VKYIKTLEELISTKPKMIPFGITLQSASILHTCGLIMGRYHKVLPNGRTVNDLDDAIFLLLQNDIQTLATGEPIKRKVICVSLKFTCLLYGILRNSFFFLLAEAAVTPEKAVAC